MAIFELFTAAVKFVFTAAYGCFFSDGNYIHTMKKDLDALQKTMQELVEERNVLLGRVAIEEGKGLQQNDQVQGWFSRVEDVESEVNDLLEDRSTETSRLCLFGYCSQDCISSYNYGKNVSKKLEEVKELLSKGDFEVVAQKTPSPKAEMKLIQATVGLDSMVEKAWNSLMICDRKALGLYGMGGVGKTTLLACINNKFHEVVNDFDVVIWVVVSKDLQYEGIQDQILKKVRLDKEWERETEEEKASSIYNLLGRKKFVLLLDDLWSEVDLNKIGVPPQPRENGSKIVFTTRSVQVCRYMKADEQLNVDCLSPGEAWELFQIAVGDVTLRSHHDIPALARIVAAKCDGLPLSLNVIGKAMTCKETVEEWRDAIRTLDSSSQKFPGMEEEILPILKFSFDSLNDEKVKLCFLYCSLFPEDYEIDKEELIAYWMCEGFIDGNGAQDGVMDQGHGIIASLVRAHLLIDCEGKTRVKMHDMIREMALWVESDSGKQKETICVKSGAQVRLITKDINWEIVRRMSVMRTQTPEISCSPKCPNLTTLLLPYNMKLVDISAGFFRFMPQLVVLDLSGNDSLIGLPEEISNLGSLKYLNLSGTSIKSLAVGLKLSKLIYLNLEYTTELESLVDVAKTFQNLQVLKLFYSGVFVDEKLMKELGQLEHLMILTATIKDAMILERIQGVDDPLAKSIRGLCLRNMSATRVVLSTVALGGLQTLAIVKCNISEEIKIDWESKERRELSPTEILLPSTSSPGFKHLSAVSIFGLEGQRDLTWLIFAQNLTNLYVGGSSTIEEIINKEKAMRITIVHGDIDVPFGKLQHLELYNLPGLEEICWNLPNLRIFNVEYCPKLPEGTESYAEVSKRTGTRTGLED